MHLKGLQSLIEYSTVRSNRSLVNYLTEKDSNYMPNKVFVHKDCAGDYTNPLRKITETRKCGDCVKQTDQREKVLIEKHTDFSVDKSALQIRSTLIAIKVGRKFFLNLYFEQMP